MMNSIVAQFGGKTREPVAPMPPAQRPQAPGQKHAEALAFVASMQQELERVTTLANRLQADLNLALMRVRDLEREAAARGTDLEAYRRYSVEVKTHLQHIVDAATRANEAALEAGERAVDEQAGKIIAKVEDDIKDLAAAQIGEKYGAGMDEKLPPAARADAASLTTKD